MGETEFGNLYVYIYCKLIRNNYECIFIYHKQKKGDKEDIEENVFENSSPKNIKSYKRVVTDNEVIYNHYCFTFIKGINFI